MKKSCKIKCKSVKKEDKFLFKDYRGMPIEAKYLVYVSIFPSIAFGMFFTDISFFLTKVQGLSDVFMGFIIMIMGISVVIASIPIGVIADKYGRKKVLSFGLIVSSLVIAAFALTADVVLLVAAAIIEGLTEAAFSAASNSMLAEKAGPEKRTAAFSYSFVVSNVAFGVGSFVILFVDLFQQIGISNKDAHIILYIVLSAMSLASCFMLFKIKESKSLRKEDRILALIIPKKSRGVLLKYASTGAILAFGAGLIFPIMTRWLDLTYNVPDSVSGPMLGITSIILGVAALIAPLIAKRVGVVKAIVLTQGLSTIFMFLIPFSSTFLIASSFYIMRSFLMNMSNPLNQSLIMGLVAEEERGVASGISSALWRLPNSLSTVIGAALIGSGMLAEPFYWATLAYIMAIMLFWFFFRKIKLPEEIV